jgi:hypothetical protein
MVRSELQALRSHRVNRSASPPLPCSIASSHMDACFVDGIYDFASWLLVSANSQGRYSQSTGVLPKASRGLRPERPNLHGDTVSCERLDLLSLAALGNG